MVGDHKCSRKSQSHVEEENNISNVPAAEASKHEELIQIHDKSGKKKVNEMDAAATSKEIMGVMKRMNELEEKMSNMDHHQSTTMPCEKEELLSATVNRANVFEKQLIVTKKALEDSLAKQEELLADIKKKRKKKRNVFGKLRIMET